MISFAAGYDLPLTKKLALRFSASGAWLIFVGYASVQAGLVWNAF